MNTAFNSALKQSTAIRKELSLLAAGSDGGGGSFSVKADAGSAGGVASTATPAAASSAAALGALSASLTTFARTIDEYHGLARQELNPAKQEKAMDRIRNFRTELGEFRGELGRLKAVREDAAYAQSRTELLGRRPFAATPENPYSGTAAAAGTTAATAHGRTMSMSERGDDSSGAAREAHAFREQSFFASTNTALDEYIARGQAVLGDLGQQRDMLKNTQRRMYTVANTLGVSGDTIRMIERRAREDKWIFWACVAVFVVFCWLCLRYLR